jgi:hypothetical protein
MTTFTLLNPFTASVIVWHRDGNFDTDGKQPFQGPCIVEIGNCKPPIYTCLQASKISEGVLPTHFLVDGKDPGRPNFITDPVIADPETVFKQKYSITDP